MTERPGGSAASGSAAAPVDAAARRRRRLRRLGILAALVTVGTLPWWGPVPLRRLEFFRVRRVVVEGTRYAEPTEIVSRLRVDTTVSIWDDVAPLVARVEGHPQVRAVRIGRRLPGTLVVRIEERLPVALVASPRGFELVDARGVTLPVDPSKVGADLPVLAARDTTLLRLLGSLRDSLPALFAEVSEGRRGGRGEVVLVLPGHHVLALPQVTVGRLAEAVAVAQDLARRGLVAAELDLRFRDQVVARLPDGS